MTARLGPSLPHSDQALPSVLVVEDDAEMAELVAAALRQEGYRLDILADGDKVVHQVTRRDYSAVVLDVLLPGPSGFEICAALRQRGTWVPVLMLTALGAVDERVRGLEIGADDYLTKPFELAELTARIRALIRLRRAAEAQVLRCGALRLEVATQRCYVGDQEVALTPREFGVLRALLRRPGIVLSREMLLEQVWGDDEKVRANAVEQAVVHLRRKIGRKDLQTVYGVGYRMVDPPPPR